MPLGDSRFELRPNGDQDFLSLHANCAFAAAEIVLTFSLSKPQEKPYRYTIQCGRDQHAVLQPEFLRYMNHHCAPNLYLDMQSQCLLCLRDVVPGDELTIFYPATEWLMAEGFDCHCGFSGCLGRIRGAAFIDVTTLKSHRVAAHILEQSEGHPATLD